MDYKGKMPKQEYRMDLELDFPPESFLSPAYLAREQVQQQQNSGFYPSVAPDFAAPVFPVFPVVDPGVDHWYNSMGFFDKFFADMGVNVCKDMVDVDGAGGALDGETIGSGVGLSGPPVLPIGFSETQQWGTGSSVTKAARSKRKMARQKSGLSSMLGHLYRRSTLSSLSWSPSNFRRCLRVPSSLNVDQIPRSVFHDQELRFLLQKELRNSDVSSLGRIVLPKKDSEINLPPLSMKEGIQLTVRDLNSSNFWIMRYRFWPNNKSRMYVLENTGDFVKKNGLRRGDFVILLQDENDDFFITANKMEIAPSEWENKDEEEEEIEGSGQDQIISGEGDGSSDNIKANDFATLSTMIDMESFTSKNLITAEDANFHLDVSSTMYFDNYDFSQVRELSEFEEWNLALDDDPLDNINQGK